MINWLYLIPWHGKVRRLGKCFVHYSIFIVRWCQYHVLMTIRTELSFDRCPLFKHLNKFILKLDNAIFFLLPSFSWILFSFGSCFSCEVGLLLNILEVEAFSPSPCIFLMTIQGWVGGNGRVFNCMSLLFRSRSLCGIKFVMFISDLQTIFKLSYIIVSPHGVPQKVPLYSLCGGFFFFFHLFNALSWGFFWGSL